MAQKEIVIPLKELSRLEVVCRTCGGSCVYDASVSKPNIVRTIARCGVCSAQHPSSVIDIIELHAHLLKYAESEEAADCRFRLAAEDDWAEAAPTRD